MLYKVFVRKDGALDCWTYDNLTNVVRNSDGQIINPCHEGVEFNANHSVFTPENNPNKLKKEVECIEISLGLNCNFNCKYCSQGVYKNQAYNGKPSDIPKFMRQLEEAGVELEDDGHITIWGGEPLVYWKTLKILIPALRERWPNHKMTTLTNGSLLTKAKVDFFKEWNIHVSLSDDGLNDARCEEATIAQKNDAIYDYAAKTLGRNFNVGVVASRGNANVIRQIATLKNRIPNLRRVYTENVVRCFHLVDGDVELSKAMFELPNEDLITLHDSAFQEFDERPIKDGNKDKTGILECFAYGAPSKVPAQCGMPLGGTLCVNLRGDIFSCHSWSAIGCEVGHLSNYDDVHLTGHTHWSLRKRCKNCAVLSLCHGDCSRIDDAAHEISCPNRFARLYAVFRRHFAGIFGVFVMAIEPVEGEMMPVNKLLNWRVPERTPFDATSPTVIPIKPI